MSKALKKNMKKIFGNCQNAHLKKWWMTIMLNFLLVSVLIERTSAVPGIVEIVAGGGPPHKGLDGQCLNQDNVKDGIGEEARFNYPWGIVFDHVQDALYVADCGCHDSEHPRDRIRRIDVKTKEVKTVAGSSLGYVDGIGLHAQFRHIAGLAVDPDLNLLYIADSGNNQIRVMYLSDYKVTSVGAYRMKVSANQSKIPAHPFHYPQSVALYKTRSGKRLLYIADTDNHAIRAMILQSDGTGIVKTLAGGIQGFKDGYKDKAQFYYPAKVVVDDIGKYLYIADHFNHAIRRLEIKTGMVTTLSGNGFSAEIVPDNKPKGVTFNYPEGLVYDPDYHILYVVEYDNNAVLSITLDDGVIKTLAGEKKGKKDGVGRLARFFHPTGLAFDPKTKILYVTDQYNHVIRSVSAYGSAKIYDLHAANRKKLVQSESNQTPYTYMILCLVAALVLFIFFFLWKCCFHRFFKRRLHGRDI